MEVSGPQYHEDFSEVTAVRCAGAARSKTGSVERWLKGKGFGFITSRNGDQNMYFDCTHFVDSEGLRHGDTVSYDTGYRSLVDAGLLIGGRGNKQ